MRIRRPPFHVPIVDPPEQWEYVYRMSQIVRPIIILEADLAPDHMTTAEANALVRRALLSAPEEE